MAKRENRTDGEKIAGTLAHNLRFKLGKKPYQKIIDEQAARIDRLLARERNKAAWDGFRLGLEWSLTSPQYDVAVWDKMEAKYGPRKAAARKEGQR